jgi:hypothetical protein
LSAVALATASSWAAQLFDVPCETNAIVGLPAVLRPDDVPTAIAASAATPTTSAVICSHEAREFGWSIVGILSFR